MHIGPEGYDEFWDSVEGPLAYYGPDGNRISMRQWADLRQSWHEACEASMAEVEVHPARIGSTYFEDPEYPGDPERGIRVSTVWLGIDMGLFFKRHAPLIFETMVFGGPMDEYQWRYATKEAALAGHEQVVSEVRAALAMLADAVAATRQGATEESPATTEED